MRRYFTLFVLLLAGIMATAQDLKITKIEPNPRMQTALVNQEVDPVGQRKCAVLHVITEGFTPEERSLLRFQLDNAHSIVKTVQDGGEIQLYVPDGTVKLTVKSEMGNYRCDFRDHGLKDGVESLTDYNVYIVYKRPVAGPKEEDMGGSYLMMTVEPKTATVYIDEQLKPIENGEVMLLLPYGKHTYRVEAPSYMNDAGTVEIGRERVELNISLSSAKATLTVNCPDAEADIYINEQKKGRGSWTGQIVDGMYVVEARKAGHRTEKQSLTLAKQEQKTVTLNAPQPIYGKLNLTSTPGNCEVYLDGKKIGKSPDVFSNILVGKHNVELRKEGYDTYKGMVEVKEGAIAELDATLSNTAETAKYANEMGNKYYNGTDVPQDYAEAVKWYRKAAEQGDAKGQCNLGWMYENGCGVTKDYAEAVKWYRKAAEQGDARGQNNLGYMYRTGHGVTKDYAEAVKWYRKAAEQGDADGQYNLGVMYENGYGVTKDYAEAVKWYRKSAEQGNTGGQFNLGVMYEFGLGVAKDFSEAYRWYRKAADQGAEAAIEALKRLQNK